MVECPLYHDWHFPLTNTVARSHALLGRIDFANAERCAMLTLATIAKVVRNITSSARKKRIWLMSNLLEGSEAQTLRQPG